jgi:hypothetical protein
MPSKLTSRSLFLSSISLAACSSGPSKPDAFCGPGAGVADTIDATGTGFAMTFGMFKAGANNDCPDHSAPNITSLTIESKQTVGVGLFTLCIPRPDRLPGGQALGTDVKIVDLTGAASSCTFLVDPAGMATGTVSTTGECSNGSAAAGFAMTIDGTIGLERTCGATTDKVTATLSGTVAVLPMP